MLFGKTEPLCCFRVDVVQRDLNVFAKCTDSYGNAGDIGTLFAAGSHENGYLAIGEMLGKFDKEINALFLVTIKIASGFPQACAWPVAILGHFAREEREEARAAGAFYNIEAERASPCAKGEFVFHAEMVAARSSTPVGHDSSPIGSCCAAWIVQGK